MIQSKKEIRFPGFLKLKDLTKSLTIQDKCDSFIVLREQLEESHKFFIVKHTQLFEFINLMISNNAKNTIRSKPIASYHEIFNIYPEQPIKFFLDLDFHGTLKSVGEKCDFYSLDESLHLIKKVAVSVFNEMFDIELNLENDFVTYRSYKEGVEKIGVHMYIAPNKYSVSNIDIHKDYVNRIVMLLPEEIQYSIDSQPNSRSNSSMRLISSQKSGRSKEYFSGNCSNSVPEIIETSESYDEDYVEEHEQIFTSLISFTKECQNISIGKERIEKIKKLLSNDKIDIKYILEHENLKPFLLKYSYSGFSNNILNFTRKLPEQCNYCNRVHENDNNIYLQVNIFRKQMNVYKKCMRMKVSNDKLECLINEQTNIREPITDIEYNTSKFNNMFREDSKELKEKHFEELSMTKAFNYFNYFHVYIASQSRIYMCDKNKEPIAYKLTLPIESMVTEYKISSDKQKRSGEKNDKNELIVSKQHNFYQLWIKSAYSNKIKRFVFDPNPDYQKNEIERNMFNGFKYNTPMHLNEDINFFINHFDNLFKKEEKVTNYVLNWIAHIFQKPHIKTTSAIVLYSDTHGVGKNFPFEIIGEILGNNLYGEVEPKNVGVKFNNDQSNKLLLVSNEISGHAKIIANELKDLITRKTTRIELKGVDAIVVNDYSNWVFTTNNSQSFQISQTDRRYMLIECTEDKMSLEVEKQFINLKKDEKKLRQLYHFFMTRDITNFNPQRDIVTTEYKTELIKADLPVHIKMIMDMSKVYTYDKKKITVVDLVEEVKKYAAENKIYQVPLPKKIQNDYTKFMGEYKVDILRKVGYDFSKIIKDEDFYERIDGLVNMFIIAK